jgi:hypothetical protein
MPINIHKSAANILSIYSHAWLISAIFLWILIDHWSVDDFMRKQKEMKRPLCLCCNQYARTLMEGTLHGLPVAAGLQVCACAKLQVVIRLQYWCKYTDTYLGLLYIFRQKCWSISGARGKKIIELRNLTFLTELYSQCERNRFYWMHWDFKIMHSYCLGEEIILYQRSIVNVSKNGRQVNEMIQLSASLLINNSCCYRAWVSFAMGWFYL